MDKLAPIRIDCFLMWMNWVQDDNGRNFMDEWEKWYAEERKSHLVELEESEQTVLNRLVENFEEVKARLDPCGDKDKIKEELFDSWMHGLRIDEESEEKDCNGEFGEHISSLKGVQFSRMVLDGNFIVDDMIDMFGELSRMECENSHENFCGHGVEDLFAKESIDLFDIWERSLPAFDDCLKGKIPQGAVAAMRSELNVVKYLISQEIIFQRWIGLSYIHERRFFQERQSHSSCPILKSLSIWKLSRVT